MDLIEELDMALKLRAEDRMDYSEVVIAALVQYLGVRSSATKKKGRDGAKP